MIHGLEGQYLYNILKPTAVIDKRPKISVKYLVVLGLLFTALPAQNPLPLAVNKVEEAKAYTSSKQYDLAVAAYKEALKQQEDAKDLAAWLETQRGLVKLMGDTMGQLIAGLDYLNKEVLPQMWEDPVSEEEFNQHCMLLTRKAEYEKRMGDFDAVKSDMQIALSYIDHQLKNGYPALAEYIFRELGNAYVRLGEYEGAKKVFQQSIDYAILHKEPDVAQFNDYGSLYFSLKKYPEALEIFEKGLDFEGVSEVDRAILQLNKAECLAHLKRYREALVINQAAAKLISDIDTTEARYKRCQFGLFENYGIIHLGLAIAGDTAQFGQAEKRYRAAIALASSIKPVAKREIAGFQIGLGEVIEHRKNFEEACQSYHQAIQLLIPEFHGTIQQQPDIGMLFPEKLLVRALEGKARCFLALGQAEKALECHELIPYVGAQLIATHAYESSSLLTLEEARDRFDTAIGIAWQLYLKTGQQRFAERAFALTEQARAVLLLQSIAKARLDFQLPPDIRRQEHELEVKIAWYEQQIAAEKERGGDGSAQKLEQLQKDQFQLKQTQSRFQDQLRKDYADYASLSDELRFLSAGGVSKLLREGQALIDYYLTDTDAYVFYFNKTGAFSARKVALPPLFRDNVLLYFTFMNSRNIKPEDKAWFLRMSYQWYQLLLQPELEADTSAPGSLLIIPDDALAFIPFDVLQYEPATEDMHWRDMQYLLHKLNTGYAYSATLWEMQQKISQDHRSNSAPKYNFAGFAPTYGANAPQGETRSVHIPDSLIYDISSTQEELNKVHALIGGQKFLGVQASEQQFKDIAPDCGILLLAMHGLANDEHPELSCLLFGRPQGDSINNNVLFSNELQIMQLQADLAVLSACHTGFGKLHKGEGVYSLARAFAVAGVPSTVMSIWRLHETTAPVLIEAFFKHLKAGKTKDEALCLAKKEFLTNDDYYDSAHPFYWAGVTVSGDLCALDFSSSCWWWILGVVVLLGVVFYYKRMRNEG